LATLKKMALDDGLSLDDARSPQFKAYSWLVGEDKPSELSDLRLLQRYGAATLYFSLAGHGWIDQEKWLTAEDVCEWQNVEECNSARMVTIIELYSNNLVGHIPVEMTHIRMLEVLDFTDNEIYGSIPSEFGKLQDLEILRLGGNLLTGVIPPQLGNLKTLEELYLHANEFEDTKIPREICALRKNVGNRNHGLTTLWADCRDDGTGFATRVICEESCCDRCFNDDSDFEFYGGFNGFDTFPPTMSLPKDPQVPGRDFPPTASPVTTSAPTPKGNLELMDDFEKHLSSLPLLVQRLKNTNSHAHKAFLWLGDSENLEGLDEMRRIQRYGLVTFFHSTVADDINWKISTGWKSNDHECSWFGISCADNDTVSEINLQSNRLSGEIPPEIALAGIGNKISHLNLSGNHIGGTLWAVGKLTHLEVLDLGANDFTGTIPLEIANLSKLKSLQLQGNSLSGDMPPEICSLTDGILEELIADCDSSDPFSHVSCSRDTCCSDCY